MEKNNSKQKKTPKTLKKGDENVFLDVCDLVFNEFVMEGETI